MQKQTTAVPFPACSSLSTRMASQVSEVRVPTSFTCLLSISCPLLQLREASFLLLWVLLLLSSSSSCSRPCSLSINNFNSPYFPAPRWKNYLSWYSSQSSSFLHVFLLFLPPVNELKPPAVAPVSAGGRYLIPSPWGGQPRNSCFFSPHINITYVFARH